MIEHKHKIIIRVDASSNLGTGHIMRCLTLAEELKQKSVNISFVCREEKNNLIDFFKKKNYRVYCLPANVDSEKDRRLTQKVIEGQNSIPDWLVVDHYAIDSSWESPIRKYVKKIMVIDDLADRKHDCDILLDQNYSLNENRYEGLVPERCIRFLGPKYALLRPQFTRMHSIVRECDGELKRILVFMGGTDATNETYKVLKALQLLKRPDIAIDVVIGISNLNRDELEKVALKMPKTVCHFNVENMAALMTVADLCIGAGGSTTWERCCIGLPSIVLILAKNQKDLTESLDKRGILINLGWYEYVKENDIKNAVEDLIEHPNKRKLMHLRGKELVDGKGTERVSEIMIKYLRAEKKSL